MLASNGASSTAVHKEEEDFVRNLKASVSLRMGNAKPGRREIRLAC